MGFSHSPFTRMILVSMVTLMTFQTAFAQFDDLGDSFSPPPPPPIDDFSPAPPASDFGGGGSNFGGAPGATGAAGAAPADGGAMTGRQKTKFSKSGIEDITNENFPETIESFDYPNADITDVVKAISELTGKNFIIDPGVRGKITILAPSKITVAEAYKAFLSALAINGYAIVPSGSFLKIRSARNAQRDGIDTYAGNYFPNADQMITRIINLKHIQAEAVNRDLRILTSKDGEMSIYGPTNSIIISDYGANIERIMKIITQLDIQGFEDQLEVIQIKFAKAKDIAELVNKIVNKGESPAGRGGAGGAFSAGVPRFTRAATTQGTAGSAYFMVIPDERSNALVVTGNKAGIARIKKLLTQLDFRIRPEDAGGVYVYYVRNGDAEKIAQTLSGVAKDASPRPSTGGGMGAPMISPISGVQAAQQEIFGGDVKITADKGTNSLVIVASKQDYEVVLNLLNKIDIARDQVFVEAVIMEMVASDALNWEVGYFKFDESGSGAKAGFSGLSQSLSELLNPAGGTGAILGFGSNDKISIKPPGQTTSIEIPSLIGFLTFLKKTANANVLSTPQILAMDNQEAEIEVGDKVVTGVRQTQPSVTGGSAVSEPIFEDATIKLKIKPFISPASNTIRMELSNTVKQITAANAAPKGLQDTTRQLATRSIKTNIVVPNGDTAVLGGLMKENDIETVSKVPLLGDIPILGWLFKSRNNTKEKTNMLIFLTPTIVRNENDARMVKNKKLDQRLKFIKSMGGRDPFGEQVEALSKGANAEGMSAPADNQEIK